MADPAAGSPSEQLAALQGGSSNAGVVHGIETGGHVVAGAIVLRAGVVAYQAGPAALKCFAGRVAAPLAGAFAGAKLAEMVHADEAGVAALELVGVHRLAGPGLAVAHVMHKIAHSNAFAGAVVGLLAAIAVGVVVAFSVAAIIGTAGMAAPLVAAAVGFGAGAAAGFVGAAMAGAGAKTGHVTGMIADGSPDVFFEGFKAARVTSPVICSDHASMAPDVIIEGSRTINVNGFPLARIGHKSKCDAVIQEGCNAIFGDDTTVSFGEPAAELSVMQQLFLSAVEIFGAHSSTRQGGALDSLLRRLVGEPIDIVTGEYADYRTDYAYRGVLPLMLTRCYAGHTDSDGLLGRRWVCSWSQRLTFNADDRTVLLEDAAGQRLLFALSGRDYDSVHLKAPYYHLTGTRARAKLFDSRTQQTLVFEAAGADPHIGRLSMIEDRNDNRIEFVYAGDPAADRLTRVTHSDGYVFDVVLTPGGLLESVTMRGEDAALVTYIYGTGGTLTAVRSLFGGEFDYGYDSRGWLTHWRDSGATEVGFDLDEEGRVLATRTPDGTFADRFVYTPAERRSQYIDATGACWTFWYNADNLVTREQDPLGAVTETEWDSLERRQSVTDTAGQVTHFVYDDTGHMLEAADWTGRVTRWSRDGHAQVTRLEEPNGTVAWVYDEHGNVVAETGPDGVVTTYAYDPHGRMLSATMPGGATAHWEYDRLGRVTASRNGMGHTTRFGIDRFGRVRSVTDPNGRETRYEHAVSDENPRGSVSLVHHPDGGEERFGYDGEGLLAARIGAEGQVARFTYGAFDLLRRMTDAAGHVTKFEYDAAARLSAVVNAAGARWSYAYDPAGRLELETDWAGRRTAYQRDILGRVQTKRLPDGSEQVITWDSRDRITGVATGPDRIHYEYDEADRLVRAATFGASTGDAPDTTKTDIRMTYDAQGRLVREVQNGTPVDYRYDEAGRRVGRSSPSGDTSYVFDPAGLLSTLHSNGHGLSFGRDALGLEVVRQVLAAPGQDAFTLRQSFDPCGRLAGQRAGQEASGALMPDPPALRSGEVSRAYAWDRSGRLAGVRDSTRGDLRQVYDARDQVGQVIRPPMGRSRLGDEHYMYDAQMNLAASDAGSHDYRVDCVVRAGGHTYVYDARGRMVSRIVARDGFRPKSWSYRWDGFDRLTEVRTPDETRWRYTYDAFGRRVAKRCVTPGRESWVSYVWDGATVAEERRDEGGSVSRWHFEPGGFRPLAKEVVIGEAAPSRFYPIVTDHLGTPKEVFSAEGSCLWQAEHNLWGRALAERVPPQRDGLRVASLGWAGEAAVDGSAHAESRLRFQNQWEDEESGLHYNLARYYDPESGQYLSQDPIGLGGGLRTHGYVHNPGGFIDPFGLIDAPGTVIYPLHPSLTPQPGSYSAGIARAWSQEQQLVRTTGSGTVNWTPAQVNELSTTGKVAGYTGHHINNAATHPAWEGDPRNIRFLQNGRAVGAANDHLYSDQGHRGNWQNSTRGRIIDRQEMIRRFTASCQK